MLFETIGRVALVAVLGILALPLFVSMRDTGAALQPGCQLAGSSERFVRLLAGVSHIDVERNGPGCRAVSPLLTAQYETPGGRRVEISGNQVGQNDSAGSFQAAVWHIPDGVVSGLGEKLVLPFWSVGAGVVLVLAASGAIIMYGYDRE